MNDQKNARDLQNALDRLSQGKATLEEAITENPGLADEIRMAAVINNLGSDIEANLARNDLRAHLGLFFGRSIHFLSHPLNFCRQSQKCVRHRPSARSRAASYRPLAPSPRRKSDSHAYG